MADVQFGEGRHFDIQLLTEIVIAEIAHRHHKAFKSGNADKFDLVTTVLDIATVIERDMDGTSGALYSCVAKYFLREIVSLKPSVKIIVYGSTP